MPTNKGYTTGFQATYVREVDTLTERMKVKVSTNLVGTEALIRSIREYRSKKIGKFIPALQSAVNFLLKESKFLCPVDTQALWNSGIAGVSGAGNRAEGYIQYRDPKAVYVHENLTAAHGTAFNTKYAKEIAAGTEHTRRPQEQAKFLENPARNLRIQNEMARRIHRIMNQ